MKYLTMPEASLVTVWVAARYLHHAGPKPASDIMITLRPSFLTEGPGMALESSIEVAINLKLFIRGKNSKGDIRLADDLLAGSDWTISFDRFAGYVNRRIVEQAEGAEEDISDVAQALVWLVQRDWRVPANPFSRDGGTWRVPNPDQERALRRWFVELGYLHPGASTFLIDPTRAIRGAVWDLSGLFSARSFVEALGQAVPTGLGHALCLALHDSDQNQSGELSLFPSISYGVQRLVRSGKVHLSTLDDGAERMVLHFPGEADQPMGITHVEVIK